MKRIGFILLTFSLFILIFASLSAQKLNDTYSFQRQIHTNSFIENKGQWDTTAQFSAHYSNMNAWVISSGFVFDVYTSTEQNSLFAPHTPTVLSTLQASKPEVRGQIIRMEFAGAKPFQATGVGMQEGVHHYILGNNSAKWIRDVHLFESVQTDELYHGVHIRVYSSTNQFRYDLHCSSGADIGTILFRFTGAESVNISANGDLVLGSSVGDIVMGAPIAYQIIDGNRKNISCGYQIKADGTIGFTVGTYNSDYELIIDPPVYSSLIGGSALEAGSAITVDTNKSAYITGETSSTNFPVTSGAYKTATQLKSCFISKFTPSGTGLVYSTYIGGEVIGTTHGTGISANAAGIVFITGYTSSKDFPTTDGSTHHNADAGFDAFVVKLKSDGSGLIYSTLIGGRSTDFSNAIVVNAAGEVYFGGSTERGGYPVTPNAFSKIFNGGSVDGFVTKLDASGNIIYSTLIGGNGDDYVRGITVDFNGAVYITGETNSPTTTFPTSPSAIVRSLRGAYDCFVSKFSAAGDSLLYSTLLGDIGDDHGTGIAVDFTGNAYVTGYTSSSKFQVTASPYVGFDTVYNGGDDGFILKLNTPGSSLEYSTFLGGIGDDYCTGIAIDACGAAYVTGYTSSPKFPTTRNGIDSIRHGQAFDCFITKTNSTGSVITYSTFVGGDLEDRANAIFVDSTGAAYITGITQSTDFPRTAGSGFAGDKDAFITKIQVGILPLSPRIVSNGPLSFCKGGSVMLEAEDKFYKTYQWFLNDSAIVGAIIPVITAVDSGLYRLDVTDASGCIGTGNVHVKVRPVPSLDAGKDILMCPDSTAQFSIIVKDSIVRYKWVPNLALSSDTIANPTAKPPVSVTYFVTITDTNGCTNFDSVHIVVLTPEMITLALPPDTLIICPNDSLSQKITVRNIATVPQKVRISSSLPEFRITAADSSIIAAQDSTVFLVQFKGSSKDSVYSCIITILDQCGNPHPTILNVRVGKPLIALSAAQDIIICQFDSTTKYHTIYNRSAVPATLGFAGGGGKFSISPLSARIPAGDSTKVGVHFTGDVAGIYSTRFYWTDQCGKKDSATSRIIVESIPLKVILSSVITTPEKIGVERFVEISLDSLNVLNQSSNKEIMLTVRHEQTSLLFDSLIAPQCQSDVKKFPDKTIITLLNCNPNLQNPIATLRYSTVVGSTLSPIVKLTDVVTGDRCITPTITGTDTLRLLAYGCEIKTLNVQFFTSALRSNVPNPASNSATVEYATVEEVPVKITLMNTLGQIAKTIIDKPHKPGVYQAMFLVNDLPEGLYFLVMDAGAYRDAKSIIISSEGR